jgi:hypothetical protein
MSLALASNAWAALPAGVGSLGTDLLKGQSSTLVEEIRWRRHRDHNHLRLYFGQQPGQYDYPYYDRPYFSERRGRHHAERRFYRNSHYPEWNRMFQPGFDFSIGF